MSDSMTTRQSTDRVALRDDMVGIRQFGDLLDACVRSQGDAEYIITPDGRSISYRAFAGMRDAAAARLADLGLRRGQRALVAVRTSAEQIALIMAVHRLGATAILCNPAYTEREFSGLIRRTAPVLVVVEPDVAGQLGDAGVRVISGEAAALAALTAPVSGPFPGRLADLGPDDPATIVATSGTTAEPKLVVYSHGNHVFAGESFRRNLSMSQRDTLMHHFPLFHMSGLGQLAAVLAAGARMLLVERFRSSTFEPLTDQFSPTVTFLNATHVKMIKEVSSGQRHGSTLRVVVLALSMADEYYDWFTTSYGDVLRDGFGMTETVTGCVTSPLVGAKRHSCGLPSPGYRIRVVTEAGGDCRPGESGQLRITCSSPYGLVRGYLDNPEATEAAFKDGWLHTGDLAHRDADGFLFWEGRSNDIIKRAGENISPREVEEVLESHPTVAEAAVVGRLDPLREEVPVAFVVAEVGHQVDLAELAAHAKASLAAFKVPVEFFEVDALPKNSVGKLVRRALTTEPGR
jgi:crotonobetaine/carnitine-CoA ligase